MLPTAAANHLQKQKDRLLRRRQAHEEAITGIDAELVQIEEAEYLLSLPANGSRAKIPKILKNLRVTRKDMVFFEVVRRKRGITRTQIAEAIKKRRGIDISVDSVTVYLSQLKADGLVENQEGRWYSTL